MDKTAIGLATSTRRKITHEIWKQIKVCGAIVRLSAAPIVNVTSGGGETGFFVLQEQRAP